MFNKYIGKFQKAEAEWVREVLEMYGDDEPKARAAVAEALKRVIARERGEPIALTDFELSVGACTFANRDWWHVGLARLNAIVGGGPWSS